MLAWIIYTASFFLRTDMIPGLRHLLVLMVVYIICRYRFSLLFSTIGTGTVQAAPDFWCERDAEIRNYTY